MLDNLDKIASILSGFGIFIGAIFVTLQFKYKHDAEVRKLYLSNYEKLEAIYIQLVSNAKSSHEDIKNLWDAFNEAELYLHGDIVKFIEKLKIKYGDLYSIEKDLEGTIDEKDRKNLIHNKFLMISSLLKELKNLKKLYRKQLVHDPIIVAKDYWKNQWQTSYTKNLIDKIFK